MVETLEPSILVNSRDAARLLAISERTVFQLRKDGQLPFCKLGGAVRFDRRALLDWVTAKNQNVV